MSDTNRLTRRLSFNLKEEEEKEENQEIYLPHFIVFHILSFLRRHEQSKTGLVCKLWQKVLAEDCFGWLETFAIPLWDSLGRYTSHDLSTLVVKARNATPVEFSYKVEEYVNPHRYYYAARTTETRLHFTINGKDFIPTNPDTNKLKDFDEIVTVAKKFPKLWRYELLVEENKYNYIFIAELNAREAERMVLAKEEVPLLKFAIALSRQSTAEAARKLISTIKVEDKANIPVKSVITQKQPLGLARSVRLYKYQLDVVNWMKSIEEDSQVGFDYTKLIPWKAARSWMLLDIANNAGVRVEDVKNYKLKCFPRGGILADEMGLGKTTEIISLILANPGDPSKLDTSKYISKSAHLVPAKVATRSTRTRRGHNDQFNDPPAPVADDPTQGPKSAIKPEDLFVTNATLVICPTHLIKQWHEEIEKTTRPHLNVVLFTTPAKVKSYSYLDIINADVVIVSYQLLMNAEFFNYKNKNSYVYPDRPPSGFYRDDNVRVNSFVDASLEEIWHNGSILTERRPILEHFYWHRVVVDEAHEVIMEKFLSNSVTSFPAINASNYHISGILTTLQASYWWYVSGTPFPSSTAVERIVNFLRFPKPETENEEWSFIDIYMNNLYWRNTKESVKDEYKLPPVVEDLVLINYTPIEAALYKDFVEYAEQEVTSVAISYPSISGHYNFGPNPSLAHIRSVFITYLEAKVEQAEKNKVNLENDLEFRKKKIPELEAELIETEEKINEVNAKVKELIKKKEEEEKKKGRAVEFSPLYYTTVQEFDKVTLKKEKLQYDIEYSKKQKDQDIDKIEFSIKRVKDAKRSLQEVQKLDAKTYTGPDMSAFATLPQYDEENEEQSTSESSAKGEKEKEEEKDDEKVELPWSEILEMKLPQVKEELTKRGVEFSYKMKKADLQRLLREAVKSNTKPAAQTEEEKEPAKPEKATEKRKAKTATTKGTKRRKTDKGEEEVEEKEQIQPQAPKTNASEPRTTQDKINEQNLLKWMVEKEGTKLANLVFYLKKLWTDSPAAKVIIFSQHTSLLKKISEILTEKEIDHVLPEGTSSLVKRVNQMKDFRKKGSKFVLLLNFLQNASGTNIVEATHIILMEPILGEPETAKSIEAQAIGRAHRQGQESQVTVTRFIVRNTIEYTTYMQNYGTTSESEVSLSGRPKIQRTQSATTALISTPSFQTPTKVVDLLETFETD